jgi:hypothetical protein
VCGAAFTLMFLSITGNKYHKITSANTTAILIMKKLRGGGDMRVGLGK